jgi:hypothetical protein
LLIKLDQILLVVTCHLQQRLNYSWCSVSTIDVICKCS